MFQPAWVIFRGLSASAWLKLLLITIYYNYVKMIKNCCYISRELFRLVGVRSVGWVVRDIRHKVQIVISGPFNNESVHFVGVIIV
jgi:hypothetical protein